MKVKKICLTKENLLEIEKIDDEFYTNAITGIDWYLERYTENHYAYCLFDDDLMVGYIISVPIKKELYDAITNGVLLNDIHINPSMFVKESEYNYIVSCVIKEEYRGNKYSILLIQRLMEDLKGKKACCLAISKEGNILSGKYMKLKMKLNDDISVYEI